MKLVKNSKGFSVVEILVVIVLVGLVSTVGWLVYDRQQSKSTESKDVNISETSSKKKAQATAFREQVSDYMLSNCEGSTESDVKKTLDNPSAYVHSETHAIVTFDCQLGDYGMNTLYLKTDSNDKIVNVLPKPVGGPSCEFLASEGFPKSVYQDSCSNSSEQQGAPGDTQQTGTESEGYEQYGELPVGDCPLCYN